jgi:cytochrome c oxidase subunit IV
MAMSDVQVSSQGASVVAGHAGVEHAVPAHAVPAHAVHQEHHPDALRYVQIAAILTAMTMAEVGVYYLRIVHEFLVPLLIGLSAFKFVLVVMFYMHLRFDNKLFSALFTLGLILAGCLLLGLLFLTGSYFLSQKTG